MSTLYFDEEADRALTRLDDDPTRRRQAARINSVLDQLETDPSDRRVRRIRFTNGLWCVTVPDNDSDWVILWERHPEDPDGVIIQYLGPASFA